MTTFQGVSDSAVCAAGIAAYNDLLGLTGTPQAATQVIVLALGGTGYALVPPEPRPQDRGRAMFYIFSSTWVLKRKYLI
jgi:hypothetical protein